MARAKRYSAEQIVAKLREHEKLQAQGLTIPQDLQADRDLRPGLLPLADQVRRAQRGRGPAPEGARAREQPAEADRGRAAARHLDAEGPAAGKMVSPARRREAVCYLQRRHRVSQRRRGAS